jgi:outer membrane protein assembly factor BamB
MRGTRALSAAVVIAALIVGIGCGSGGKSTSDAATNPVVVDDAGGASAAKQHKHAANWPTYHANLARTGVDTTSPAVSGFHRTWTQQFDGQVYAEPLAVGNRVYVATENNTVYALNARNGRIAWKRHLGTPVQGSTLPCGNIEPVTGITGTPAISGGAIYATAFLEGYRHVLFGLSLRGGKVMLKRRIDAPGSDPRVHQQRSALSVSRGRVYVPFGGLAGDCGDYRGRVVSVRTHGKPAKRTFTVGVHREGAIWAPSGAAIDRSGSLFVATGNGDELSGFDFGNSVIRLSPKLRQTGFYRAPNSPQLNQTDADLGSVGPTLLGGNRMFVIGKEGVGLILSTTRLGGTGGDLFNQAICTNGGAFGGLAYRAPLLFVPCIDGLHALRVSGNSFTQAWQAGSSAGPPILAGGVVWTIDSDATLHGYAPDSGADVASVDLGSVTHFPTAPGHGAGPAGTRSRASACPCASGLGG